MASSNFSWAASPPSRTAAATQCSRWSFSTGHGHRLEGAGDGGDLGHDVDAVLVLLHHAGDPARLPLDQPEPPQVGLFVGGVAVLRAAAVVFFLHADDYTPQG